MTTEEQGNERIIRVQGDADRSTLVAGDGNTVNQYQAPVYYTSVFSPIGVAALSPNASEPLSKQEYRWRQVLIDKVKHYWIEGVLEKSLHNQALIDLGLEERAQAIASPLIGVGEFSEEAAQIFPSGTQATDLFDNLGAGRTLLILGEPGAGKTTVLLKLAESLINRVENDLSQPIPVILNLSSWAKKRLSIEKWLVKELNETFQISKSLGDIWVAEEQLILCLDGLDEVAAKHRNACVHALNLFIQTHGRTEIVICSRIKDYEALAEQLKLQMAICVQPLSPSQINHFIEQAGESLAALGIVLSNSSELKSFASSPLILNIMSLAYRGCSLDEVRQLSIAETLTHSLFDSYVERMFQRRGTTRQYSRQKTERWLAYLAQDMIVTSQTIFFIEKIQPSWLKTDSDRLVNAIYTILIGGIAGKLIVMLTAILVDIAMLKITKYIYSDITYSYPLLKTLLSVRYLLWGGLLEGVIVALLIVVAKGEIKPVETLFWQWEKAKNYLRNFLNGCSWLIPGFIGGFIGWQKAPALGIFLGLYVLVLFNAARWDNRKVRTPNWSWKLLRVEIAAIVPTLLGFLIIWQPLRRPLGLISIEGTILGAFLGLLLGFCYSGISYSELTFKARPNQGIWNSARNAFALAVLAYILSFMSYELYLVARFFTDGSSQSMKLGQYVLLYFERAFPLSMLVAFPVACLGGGITCIRHVVLRFTLYRKGYSPKNYARFLDYAADRLFLQKVGGGYIFIHRMLLEHFAQMKSDHVRG